MQGTLQAGGGPKRYVRFGSAKFATAVLPEDQRSKLLQQVGVSWDLRPECIVLPLVVDAFWHLALILRAVLRASPRRRA